MLREYKQPVLVQSFLPGREFNVSIIGGRRLRVMPLAEVNYSELPPDIPPIMSYAAKCIETTVEYQKTSVTCPAVVETELAREIVSTSLRAFRAVGAWGYGRVDVRLDAENRPCILEVNCNPCLEDGYGLSRQAACAGISYPHLLQMIVKAALGRHALRRRHPDDVTSPPTGRASRGRGPFAAACVCGDGRSCWPACGRSAAFSDHCACLWSWLLVLLVRRRGQRPPKDRQ